MLEIVNATKIFNSGSVDEKIALNGLSLTLNDGDFVTVIGSNGAGKSTLLNAIAGTFTLESGEIKIDGKDITKMPEHKRARFLGRVFQDPNMGTAGDMNIEENLALAYRRGKKHTLKWGITKNERASYKDMLAKLGLGLEKRLEAKVKLLSGGQRQAITLLMAAMNSPRLLLLDEHTAALDPKTAEIVLGITDEIVQENNLTTLMVTHNMRDAIKHGNRLIMMSDGKVVVDVSGETKKNLTVEQLIQMFSNASQNDALSDKAIL